MKNVLTLNLRVFPVVAHDHRDGEEKAITVTCSKDQLRAAGMVGQSSKELVERMLDRQGYTALEIGKPDKLSVVVDLDKLVERHEEQTKWDYLYGAGGGGAGA